MVTEALYIPGLMVSAQTNKYSLLANTLRAQNINLQFLDFSDIYKHRNFEYSDLTKKTLSALTKQRYNIIITQCIGAAHYLSSLASDPHLEAEKSIFLVPPGDFSKSPAMEALRRRKLSEIKYENSYFENYMLPAKILDDLSTNSIANLNVILQNESMAFCAIKDGFSSVDLK